MISILCPDFQCYNFYRELSIFSAHCKLIAATTVPLCTNTEKCTSSRIIQLRGTKSMNKGGWVRWPQIHIGNKFYKIIWLTQKLSCLPMSSWLCFILKKKKKSQFGVNLVEWKTDIFSWKYTIKKWRARSTTKPKLLQDPRRRASELN